MQEEITTKEILDEYKGTADVVAQDEGEDLIKLEEGGEQYGVETSTTI